MKPKKETTPLKTYDKILIFVTNKILLSTATKTRSNYTKQGMKNINSNNSKVLPLKDKLVRFHARLE